MVSDISLFFEPLPNSLFGDWKEGTIGARIEAHTETAFPHVSSGTVVIFSVSEFRGAGFQEIDSEVANSVRKELYALKDHFGSVRIIDLGVISPGDTVKDTYYAVSSSSAEIIRQGGLVFILGGSQDLTYANYTAYEKLEQVVNLVSVDARFDLGDVDDEVRADRYLQKIILHQPNILFNFSNLGYQTHHAMPNEVELMKKMYFDVYRLGELQGSLEEVEPVVRNADILSFDMASVRTSDNPANWLAEPNGLYGEEACAIMRYAGLSDKLTSAGIYNLKEFKLQSSKLAAQMVWYFLLGVANRKKDYPFASKDEYTKYIVTLENGTYDIIFYKSSRSDRWWMEVPYPSKRGQKYQRHFMVPCNYSDYQLACEDGVPDRWWQTFQKLG
ncbi:MAG: formimidoylglutamase [Flavobacteriales bacterium]|nr:formimidoylglutamase [Flavobacteriales bacterium]